MDNFDFRVWLATVRGVGYTDGRKMGEFCWRGPLVFSCALRNWANRRNDLLASYLADPLRRIRQRYHICVEAGKK